MMVKIEGFCEWRELVKWLAVVLVVSQLDVSLEQTDVSGDILIYSTSLQTSYYVLDSTPNLRTVENNQFSCLGDFGDHGLPNDPYSMNVEPTKPAPLSLESSANGTGRCLYKGLVQLLAQKPGEPPSVTSFSTMFLVSLQTNRVTSKEFAFVIMGPNATQSGSAESSFGQVAYNLAVHLEQHNLGRHVAIKITGPNGTAHNSTTIDTQISSGYKHVLAIWIDYNGFTHVLEVRLTMPFPHISSGFFFYYGDGFFPSKPKQSALSCAIDLANVFQERMGIGFWAASSNMSGAVCSRSSLEIAQRIVSESSVVWGYDVELDYWSFNENGPVPDWQRNSDMSLVEVKTRANKKGEILSTVIPVTLVFCVPIAFLISVLIVRNSRLHALAKKYRIEELEQLGRGPERFKYKALSVATDGFSDENLLGTGGFGSVYKGRLSKLPVAQNSPYVAIKRIAATSDQGAREFLAEVKIIGQAQHRNLVRLRGWCYEHGELLLVYDFMPNGSLDQHLYSAEEEGPNAFSRQHEELSWARRLKILSGVATALAFLHDDWEKRVIHRDVKSSNVMLDVDFNARLGDFGLALSSDHAQAPPSTVVLAGTRGYLAPELYGAVNYKFTEKTDVYSFGTVVLEVATGRRPLFTTISEETRSRGTQDTVVQLVNWVWDFNQRGPGDILEAADPRLEGAFDRREMVTVLRIGLLCCHPDPEKRPTMRQVLNIWTGASKFPPLPDSKPTPVFVSPAASLLSSQWTDDSETDASPMIPNSAPMQLGSSDDSERSLHARANRRQWTSVPWKATPLPT